MQVVFNKYEKASLAILKVLSAVLLLVGIGVGLYFLWPVLMPIFIASLQASPIVAPQLFALATFMGVSTTLFTLANKFIKKTNFLPAKTAYMLSAGIAIATMISAFLIPNPVNLAFSTASFVKDIVPIFGLSLEASVPLIASAAGSTAIAVATTAIATVTGMISGVSVALALGAQKLVLCWD